MRNLIQDLLDYAQIKAGKFRTNFEEFNIRETIEEVIEIQKKQALAKNIDLCMEFHGIAYDELDRGLASPFIVHD